jgi:hypothetical protein
MATNWFDRQVDDLLLATSVATGYVYARRRTRRALRTLTRGAMVVGAGATLAGIGAVGVAGALVARRRRH